MPRRTPSRYPWRWPVSPLYLPSQAGPDVVTLRPCGCHADPSVFGHWHTFDGDRRAYQDTAGAA